MIFQAGRSVSKLRAQCVRSRCTLLPSKTERAPVLHKLLSSSDEASFLLKPSLITPILRRFYADQPVSRPKAHTGRTTNPGRKAPATSSTKADQSAARKKIASSATAKVKSQSKSKSKSKAKPKPKKSVKAKAKAKPKKVLTEKQKVAKARRVQLDKVKNLRKTALLDSPNASPVSAWMVFVAEHVKSKGKDTKATDVIKEIGPRWKAITPEELEHYNHLANQRSAAKKTAWIKWIESHTPEQIFEANNARHALTKLRKIRKQKRGTTYPPIKDDRLVRRPVSSYVSFYKGRQNSGDFKGLKISEAASLAGREWKALSAAERKPFEDAALQDRQRYEEEKKTVYKK